MDFHLDLDRNSTRLGTITELLVWVSGHGGKSPNFENNCPRISPMSIFHNRFLNVDKIDRTCAIDVCFKMNIRPCISVS